MHNDQANAHELTSQHECDVIPELFLDATESDRLRMPGVDERDCGSSAGAWSRGVSSAAAVSRGWGVAPLAGGTAKTRLEVGLREHIDMQSKLVEKFSVTAKYE